MPKKPEKKVTEESVEAGIGKRLRDWVYERWNSEPEFCKAMGKGKNYYYAYLRQDNPRMPGAKVLSEIGKAGCDLNWILLGTKYKPSGESLQDAVESAVENCNRRLPLAVSDIRVLDDDCIMLYFGKERHRVLVEKSKVKTDKK